MKKKSLLTAIVILSVLLVGIGTSYAIYGVADDVKAQDLVWPVICSQDGSHGNNLNTNWAISELVGASGGTDLAGNAVKASCELKSVKSTRIIDFDYKWTPFDVVVDDFQSFLVRNPNSKLVNLDGDDKLDLELVVDNVKYWAGYIVCIQSPITPVGGSPADIVDRFMNNVYLVDLPLGFASGFNGPSLEGNDDGAPSDNLLGEGGINQWHMTANSLFARYFINNDKTSYPNTWDWWIVLTGRNQYNITDFLTSNRVLTGVICDEYENCQSLTVGIPYELNIISVDPLLPGTPFFVKPGETLQSFPKAGFGDLFVFEQGSYSGEGSFDMFGTINHGSQITGAANASYSLFGWSYQRAQAATALADFDVIHPMFRTYCTGQASFPIDYVDGVGSPYNIEECYCNPTSGTDGACGEF